ncbi:hypothetical protein OSTOST_09031 [Ostertagia ostertagi]
MSGYDICRMENDRSPTSSPRTSDDITPTPDDRISGSSDPRGSQLDGHGDPVEKHAPVKRKKFPLGASENERRSQDVVVCYILHRIIGECLRKISRSCCKMRMADW